MQTVLIKQCCIYEFWIFHGYVISGDQLFLSIAMVSSHDHGSQHVYAIGNAKLVWPFEIFFLLPLHLRPRGRSITQPSQTFSFYFFRLSLPTLVSYSPFNAFGANSHSSRFSHFLAPFTLRFLFLRSFSLHPFTFTSPSSPPAFTFSCTCLSLIYPNPAETTFFLSLLLGPFISTILDPLFVHLLHHHSHDDRENRRL